MKIILSLLLTLNLSFGYSQKLWISLFNGKDLSGWQKVGDNAPFDVIGGSIILHQKANTKEHSFLRTKKKYTNFILEFDAKRDSLFNYGVLFRAQNVPDTAHVRLYGYQVKIDHSNTRRWTGAIFDDYGNTWDWISTNENDKKAQYALYKAGQWDHFRVEALDNNIRVFINGIQTADISNQKYKTGYIALKIHFLGNKPEMEKHKAEFKNIGIISKNVKTQLLKINSKL